MSPTPLSLWGFSVRLKPVLRRLNRPYRVAQYITGYEVLKVEICLPIVKTGVSTQHFLLPLYCTLSDPCVVREGEVFTSDFDTSLSMLGSTEIQIKMETS